MDSGNSGSLQSSSGGDEEYDSRTESISAFLNPTSHLTSLSNPSHHHHQLHPPSSSSSLFDPLSNYLDSFSRLPAAAPPPPNTSSSQLNLDMLWSGTLRSEPTCTEIPTGGGLMGSSSSAQLASGSQGGPFQGLSSTAKNGGRPSASSSSDQINPVRSNSKKRSRASRRAPTTVLTTDTSNFRAMVQEFTGIPAPPFSASPFPRSRFDLFPSSSTTSMPSYLLRPFAQKFHPPSFPYLASSASTSSSSSIASVTNPTGTTSGAAGSSNNHQLLSDLGLTKQTHQSLLNMQNPIFTFQSRLQPSGPPPPVPPPRYPLPNVPVFTMGGHGLPSLVTSDGISLRNDTNTNTNTNTNTTNNNNPSMNYSSSSLEFQVEKGSENVSSRGEGMVDSWICSSD